MCVRFTAHDASHDRFTTRALSAFKIWTNNMQKVYIPCPLLHICIYCLRMISTLMIFFMFDQLTIQCIRKHVTTTIYVHGCGRYMHVNCDNIRLQLTIFMTFNPLKKRIRPCQDPKFWSIHLYTLHVMYTCVQHML